ncbi:CPBP family intramembrane glutamic endopeptidase [Ancrocorticia populi]|uniref:CPBP family intramembrane glutamic endopeptidase n=1 Tax=Ancrocorticia populi TaxID=2175228 RepID=UPI0010581E88|nr:CPBP family intramembrane glutamic endopeptidase [Ancrocorticia populi]
MEHSTIGPKKSDTHTPTSTKTRNSVIRAATMIVLYFAVNSVLGPIMVGFGWLTPHWAQLTVYVILFAVSISLYAKHLAREWHRFRTDVAGKRLRFFGELILMSVVGTVCTGLASVLAGSETTNQENIEDMVEVIPVALGMIVIVLLGPLIEELTFRQSIIGAFPRPRKWLLGVLSVVSVLIFDAVHIAKLSEFWVYLPMAVLLVLFYLRHRCNVWATILFHSFYNCAGFVLIVL